MTDHWMIFYHTDIFMLGGSPCSCLSKTLPIYKNDINQSCDTGSC